MRIPTKFTLATILVISIGQSNAEAASTSISPQIAIVDTGNGGGGHADGSWYDPCDGLSYSSAC